MKISTKTIGHRIKIARAIRQMSQSDLAKKCGVSRAYVGLFEAVGIKNLKQVADALNVPVLWILGEADINDIDWGIDSDK
jgi:transcriptional regulator with XRE-family HTH domain